MFEHAAECGADNGSQCADNVTEHLSQLLNEGPPSGWTSKQAQQHDRQTVLTGKASYQGRSWRACAIRAVQRHHRHR